ncbi:MAG: UvrD-helicase domain-containing protein, partial [Arenimonas sp.]
MTRPLALELPLQGRQWIEASAGTGKTFTLSLLVLRFLLEREIALPNILAVTFTNAATQELKIKIRDQIKLAQDLLNDDNEDLECLDAGKQAIARYLRDLILEKPKNHLQHLLESALQDCDRASIFTIHGFCSRVLGDFALSAGQVLQAPSLLTNTAALNTKIAFDIWREFSLDRNLMRSLIKLWPTPELLAWQTENLLQAEHLLPEAPATLPVDFDMSALDELLRKAVDTHMQDAIALLEAAGDAGIINGVSFRPAMLKAAFDNLSEWREANSDVLLSDPGFSKLRSQVVRTKQKFHDREPKSPLFDAIELWYQGYEQLREFELARDAHCLHLVRERLRVRREQQLQKQQQYSYDDLISQLVQGLQGESADELCERLRKDYPVALVDEFQDTDSQQWKIFSTLYPEHAPENLPIHALYLIGDPKQAIYGFRGGDVHAYLAAKQQSQRHWNLPENFRSRPGLLSAVASLFEQGGEHAFREHDIRFYPVHTGGTVGENNFLLEDKPAPAMQLAVLPGYLNQKQEVAALPMPKANELATRACVEKIHELLTAGQQSKARLIEKKTRTLRGVEPGDIAVLVNQNKQATQIQAALAACGISSVISSRENLFSTEQAQEVFMILDALIRNQDQARWRGALSTVLLGYHAEQIAQLEFDDVAASESADLAVHYRELWFSQGVLSLLSQLCATAAPRLLPLADGERRLSNYLQLAESLQEASALTLGPEHCLRWLGQTMQVAGSDEENMLRLDSDQQRVKIMTLHKSKGLEFPLVFLPFANFGKSSPSRSGAGLNLLNYHHAHRRISHAMLYGETNVDMDKTIKALAAEEQIAEQVRLLYVGLT